MLSILIPVYQQEVRPLVLELHRQGVQCGIEFEIRVMDDKSADPIRLLNRPLEELEGVFYSELESNLGRAAIRNALGKSAQFPYLLFIDGDARVNRPYFIQTYLYHLQPTALLVGGTSYCELPPADIRLRLRWKYGQAREARPLAFRQRYTWQHFSTFQFVIPRDIHLRFPFDETLQGYGHEDTLLGAQLAKAGIEIVHLDNPLEHLGLDEAAVFLDKTDQSIRNLLFLEERNGQLETRLSRWATQAPRALLWFLLLPPARQIRKWLRRKLAKGLVFLWLFDLYKLLTYSQFCQAKIVRSSSNESTR